MHPEAEFADRTAVPPSAAAAGPSQQELLARRDAILAGVSQASEQLLSAAKWREAIDGALAILGRSTRVDRVYVFEIFRSTAEQTLLGQRYEWVSAGTEPQIHNQMLQAVDLEQQGFDRWASLMRASRPVVGDIEDFPPAEQEFLAMQGIQSILVQPIHAGSRWWGFIGFDACAVKQSWEPVEVDALRIASLVLGSKIHLQEREEQFRQAQKMEALGRMAGGVAHDFNNCLMIIASGVDLLRSGIAKGRSAEAMEPHLRLIERAKEQSSGLTRRLLQFSRQGDGVSRLVDPLALVLSNRSLLQQAVGPTVVIEVDAPGRIDLVKADPVEFEQVLLNLAVNARDAMPHGGHLQISVVTLDAGHDPALADRVPPGRWTLLRVGDSGEGMPPEIRERIFEPFFTTKDVDRGTGLGLATVFGIVSKSGGRIEVTSQPGSGTEFRIYLPAVAAAEGAAERPQTNGVSTDPARGAREPAASSPCILVCDDNPPIVEWVCGFLVGEGYRVCSATSGKAALALPEVERGEIDLLVSDVIMPGITGPALRERLRERCPGLPTIFISGYTSDVLERHGLSRESETLLGKPFTLDRLLEEVAAAVGPAVR